MQDSGDTWDVFVVGVRDNSHASTVMLAAELSHYTGIPTSEMELALMKGEVRVRAGLNRTEAENAALELDDRGAIVDLRLSDGKSGVFPILKPDASRRSGTAVGGFIDDSATPPSMSDTSGLQTLPLEPDHEDGLPPPPMPSGGFETLEDVASEPIRVDSRRQYGSGSDDLLDAVENLAQQGEGALGRVDEYTGHGPSPGDKQIVDVPHQRSPDSVPPLFSRASAAPEWTTDPPSQPHSVPAPRPTNRRPAPQRPPTQPSMPAVGQPAPAMPGAAVPPIAYAPPPGYPPPPAMHPGAYGAPAPAMPPGYPMPPHGVPPTAVPPPAAMPPAAAPMPQPTPVPSTTGSSPALDNLAAGLDSLETTDLPTAPKAKPKKKKKKKKKKKPTTEAPAVDEPPPPNKTGAFEPAASQSLELDFEAVGISPKNKKLKQLGGRITGEHQPADAESPRRTRAGNMGGTGDTAYGRGQATEDLGEFVLGADVTTALPLGLAIGLGVGLAAALFLQRGASHKTLEPLEQEMLLAATNPETAGVGDVRSASQVEEDLKAAYGSLKNTFLLQWLGIGIPLGFVLSRIPRRQ